jgi:hypothetical protein
MIDWLATAWATLRLWLDLSWAFLLDRISRNPIATMLAVLAFVRLWGTTVQTGYAGVLFSFGRAKKVLEPGFHPLIPIIQDVRKLPIRSVTVELPPQRLTSADGLVYDVDATLVLRITDPIKATVEIDHLRAGCVTVLSLAVAEVIASQTALQRATKGDLDAAITQRVQADLERWGVTVEQAGLNTIAPTRTTTRLSQQYQRLRERAVAYARLCEAGLPMATALTLLGATRQVVGRSRARYHRLRLAVLRPLEPPAAPARAEEDDPLEDDLPI